MDAPGGRQEGEQGTGLEGGAAPESSRPDYFSRFGEGEALDMSSSGEEPEEEGILGGFDMSGNAGGCPDLGGGAGWEQGLEGGFRGQVSGGPNGDGFGSSANEGFVLGSISLL